MFNPYVIILILFIIAGIIMTGWGWRIIARSRSTSQWPKVDGVIEQSHAASDANDLLPHIAFCYTVAGQFYQHNLEFPSGTQPSPELTAVTIKKYPTGASVQVSYNPNQPDQATLEPGIGSDWIIFALGLITTLFGIAFLFFSG